MVRFLIQVFCLAVFAALLSGCGGPSPSTIVRKTADAVLKEDLSGIEKNFLDDEDSRKLVSDLKTRFFFQIRTDTAFRIRLQKVSYEIKAESIDQEAATVTVHVTQADYDEELTVHVPLKKEDGDWKIDIVELARRIRAAWNG